MADLDLTLIQSDVSWENPGANLEAFDRTIRALPGGAELVLLPEMFSTGFTMHADTLAQPMTGASVRWMQRTAQEKNIILAGSLIIEEDARYYNRLLWALPDGSLGHYDKRHLFAFAGEDAVYTPGQKKVIARVKGWKVCLSICYDLRFPVWLRQPREAGKRYDLLISVASWPESRAEAWKTLLRARAIENQCYVAGVNRTGTDGYGIRYAGGSCVFGPGGETVLEAQDQPETPHAVLEKSRISAVRDQFPFLDDADSFSIFVPKS